MDLAQKNYFFWPKDMVLYCDQEGSMKIRLLLLVGVMAVVTLSAQTFVSARSGMVNYEEGKFVTSPHQLQDGEVFTAHGRSEILLMAGTYMRLERSAEIQMASTRLTHPAVELRAGIVAIEASTIAKDSDAVFSWGDYRDDKAIILEHKGLYRFEISDSGDALKVMVQSGQLHIPDSSTTLKDGQELILTSKGITELAKFDKKAQDDFDVWSSSRTGTLSAASYRSASSLSAYPPSSSMWAFNSYMGMYTFLPYGGMVMSPYGNYGYYWPGNVYNYYPPYYGGGGYGYYASAPVRTVPGVGGQNGGIGGARPAPRVGIASVGGASNGRSGAMVAGSGSSGVSSSSVLPSAGGAGMHAGGTSVGGGAGGGTRGR